MKLNLLTLLACLLFTQHSFAQTADEKAAKRAATLARKRKLEACCLLVGITNSNDKSYEEVIQNHEERNKKILMQKWQAERTQKCLDNISKEQVDAL